VTIHNLLFNLTKLGDAALLLPLTTLLFVIYWRYQSRSAALWLVGAVGFCAVLTILLKVTFMTCAGVWHTGITSPSGHTSMGTVVYGAAGLLAVRHTSTPQRWVLLALTATLIAVIAVSRIATGAHNFGEVLVGLAVGATACMAFAVYYLRRPMPALNVAVMLAALAALTAVLAGQHANLEPMLRHASSYFLPWQHVCTSVIW